MVANARGLGFPCLLLSFLVLLVFPFWFYLSSLCRGIFCILSCGLLATKLVRYWLAQSAIQCVHLFLEQIPRPFLIVIHHSFLPSDEISSLPPSVFFSRGILCHFSFYPFFLPLSSHPLSAFSGRDAADKSVVLVTSSSNSNFPKFSIKRYVHNRDIQMAILACFLTVVVRTTKTEEERQKAALSTIKQLQSLLPRLSTFSPSFHFPFPP